ncbi:MAG: tRNA uridine-5-carboxymethylaminomethyl(34) synthesis GTPase MnmE [Alphaproteobacteria bacterium]|nr:MAG: tRNA uridine-5-carboxymethylaminomethyl(34) synthesis GTPase MnmE [Alphaproteobacteria bacterium]
MTIFALSSGKGIAGIAVIRISGPKASDVLTILTQKDLPTPRAASLRALYRQGEAQPIDHSLVLWFPAPGSFTGEDMAELHIHGGVAVIEAVLGAIAAIVGCHPAEPGEFTRRAFEQGRLDLTEAEGIADLIAAETEAQRLQAVRQMDGALGEIYEAWRTDLIHALAYMEAELDFVEEALPEDLFAHVLPTVDKLIVSMGVHLNDKHRGERLRDGYQVVLLGAPNVGKSSLINALTNRDVAIVSDIAGTTRDLIEVHLNLGGFPVTLVDTAGLRDGGDEIEQEGVRRARDRASHADLSLHLYPAGEPCPSDLSDSEMLIITKIDLLDKGAELPGASIGISTKTGVGLDALLKKLEERVVKDMAVQEAPGITRIRHRKALEEAVEHLNRAKSGTVDNTMPELVAEDMRLAARALGRITGRVDVEDVLDVIFSDFCIGK